MSTANSICSSVLFLALSPGPACNNTCICAACGRRQSGKAGATPTTGSTSNIGSNKATSNSVAQLAKSSSIHSMAASGLFLPAGVLTPNGTNALASQWNMITMTGGPNMSMSGMPRAVSAHVAGVKSIGESHHSAMMNQNNYFNMPPPPPINMANPQHALANSVFPSQPLSHSHPPQPPPNGMGGLMNMNSANMALPFAPSSSSVSSHITMTGVSSSMQSQQQQQQQQTNPGANAFMMSPTSSQVQSNYPPVMPPNPMNMNISMLPVQPTFGSRGTHRLASAPAAIHSPHGMAPPPHLTAHTLAQATASFTSVSGIMNIDTSLNAHPAKSQKVSHGTPGGSNDVHGSGQVSVANSPSLNSRLIATQSLMPTAPAQAQAAAPMTTPNLPPSTMMSPPSDIGQPQQQQPKQQRQKQQQTSPSAADGADNDAADTLAFLAAAAGSTPEESVSAPPPQTQAQAQAQLQHSPPPLQQHNQPMKPMNSPNPPDISSGDVSHSMPMQPTPSHLQSNQYLPSHQYPPMSIPPPQQPPMQYPPMPMYDIMQHQQHSYPPQQQQQFRPHQMHPHHLQQLPPHQLSHPPPGGYPNPYQMSPMHPNSMGMSGLNQPMQPMSSYYPQPPLPLHAPSWNPSQPPPSILMNGPMHPPQAPMGMNMSNMGMAQSSPPPLHSMSGQSSLSVAGTPNLMSTPNPPVPSQSTPHSSSNMNVLMPTARRAFGPVKPQNTQ